jgi:hypothetical protein
MTLAEPASPAGWTRDRARMGSSPAGPGMLGRQ